jgi:hypothetical protein
VPETAIAKGRPFQLAMQELADRSELDKGGGLEIAANVADQILTAQTVEDVIGAPAQGPGNLDDLVGKPFYFTGYLRFLRSAEQFREGGVGVYVVFDILDMNGNKTVMSTGAVNVVFQLRQMERLGYFASEDWVSDKMFTIRSRPTANGTLYRIDFA